jgi:hypothetical protein
MLAIAIADIASAHANLWDFAEAIAFARESISCIRRNPTFAETEANAHIDPRKFFSNDWIS